MTTSIAAAAASAASADAVNFVLWIGSRPSCGYAFVVVSNWHGTTTSRSWTDSLL